MNKEFNWNHRIIIMAFVVLLATFFFSFFPLPTNIDIYKFWPKKFERALTKQMLANEYYLIFVNPIEDIHAETAGSGWGHGAQFSFQICSMNSPLKLKNAPAFHAVSLLSDDKNAWWLKGKFDREPWISKCYYLSPENAEKFAKGGIRVYMNSEETRAWVYSPMVSPVQ